MEPHSSPNGGLPDWLTPRVMAAGGLALLFVVFALQNGRSVQVDFLFWDFRLRLIILMLLCAAAGAAIWELVRYLRRRNTDG